MCDTKDGKQLIRMEINIMNDQKKQKKKAERCRISYLPNLDKKATN